MAEDETTFLCGYKGLRRYGTTSSYSSSSIGGGANFRCNYSTIIKHRVLPSDTLQGIALKYGASTTEIKRLNKLWSNDSIHLREILRVPILSTDASPSSTSFGTGGVLSSFPRQQSASGNAAVVNGRDSCYDSMSENEEQQYYIQQQQRADRKPSISEDDDGNASCHSAMASAAGASTSAAKSGAEGQQKKTASSNNNYDKSDCSIKDLLSRIDSSIKLTASNVKRLEKQSTIEQILQEDPDYCAPSSSSMMSASQSRHSTWSETQSAGAPSPPPEVIRTEVRRPHAGRYSMRKLQEVHDQLYQL